MVAWAVKPNHTSSPTTPPQLSSSPDSVAPTTVLSGGGGAQGRARHGPGTALRRCRAAAGVCPRRRRTPCSARGLVPAVHPDVIGGAHGKARNGALVRIGTGAGPQGEGTAIPAEYRVGDVQLAALHVEQADVVGGMPATKLNHTSSSATPPHLLARSDPVALNRVPGVTEPHSRSGFVTGKAPAHSSLAGGEACPASRYRTGCPAWERRSRRPARAVAPTARPVTKLSSGSEQVPRRARPQSPLNTAWARSSTMPYRAGRSATVLAATKLNHTSSSAIPPQSLPRSIPYAGHGAKYRAARRIRVHRQHHGAGAFIVGGVAGIGADADIEPCVRPGALVTVYTWR